MGDIRGLAPQACGFHRFERPHLPGALERWRYLAGGLNRGLAVRTTECRYVIVHDKIAFEGGTAEGRNNSELVGKLHHGCQTGRIAKILAQGQGFCA